MEPPSSNRNRRPRPRHRRPGNNQHGDGPHFSFARHSAHSEVLGEPPPLNLAEVSDNGAQDRVASAQAVRARSGAREGRGATRGRERGRPPSSAGPRRGRSRGGRATQHGTPRSNTRSTHHGSLDDVPSGPCRPEGDNCQNRSVPGDDSSNNYFHDRSTFPVGADRPSRSKVVSFPKFADITAAMTLRREEIGLASEKSVSLHVHDCYLQAASSDVRATLGSFHLVPDRGLGRVVTIANCDPVTLCGAAVAFCDPEKQYVCYGEILSLDGKLVALLFDGLGVTDDKESHEFVLVNLNLAANYFINHLASMRSKSFDDMKRVESLLEGEVCVSTESGLQATHDEAAIQAALDSSLKSNSARTHPLDENQMIAVKAAVTSQRGVLIHAPSGTGDKELLRSAVEVALTVDSLKNRGPVLVIGNGITPMFRNKPAGLFCLDTEVRKSADAVQESATAILSKGKMNESLLRMKKVLKDLCILKSTILHQSRFHGITREFSTKRSEERNCVEKWLMQGVSRNDMLAVVSVADIDAYHEDCQYALEGSGVSTKSNCLVGFRYERAQQTSQGTEGFPDDLKAAYIWKILKLTANLQIDAGYNIMQLQKCHRWQLYKQWTRSLRKRVLNELEDAQNEVLNSYLHCGQMLSENVSRPPFETSVIAASVATAIAHSAVIESMQPKVLVLFRAHQVPLLLASSLFCSSISRLILIGDNVCSQEASSSLWSCAFSSQGFELHELSVQYFLSQPVCNLLAPFTKNVLKSGCAAEPLRGIAESAQFFDVPEEEAVFMISRLCHHFQTHDYQPRDVAIVTVSPSTAVATQMVAERLRQVGCTYTVWSLKSLSSSFCKILVLLVGSGAPGSDLAAALSRARCAVYGFGRLESADESCQNVFNTAHENNRRAKPALSLSCVRHPGTIVRIESGNDFVKKLQETGGCMQPCGAKRRCGHTCPEMCHKGDHPGACDRPCLKHICSRNHPCPNKCSERCPERCSIVVTDKLPCTHTATLPCYKWEQGYVPVATPLSAAAPVRRSGALKYKCKIPVTVNLECGHTAQVSCFERRDSKGTNGSAFGPISALSLRQYKCTIPVMVSLPCGHTTRIPCFEEQSTVSASASAFKPPGVLAQHKCTVPVTVVRDCGHRLQIACFENRLRTTTAASELVQRGERVVLPSCRESVQVTPSCGHTKTIQCCDKARYRCDVSVSAVRPCGHSCYVSCGADRRVFPPCTVQVSVVQGCGHSVYGTCNRVSSMKCTKYVHRILPCGHRVDVPCSQPSPQCRVIVSKLLPCGHVNVKPCFASADPCESRCGHVFRCKHTCKLACFSHPHESRCEDCKDKCSVS